MEREQQAVAAVPECGQAGGDDLVPRGQGPCCTQQFPFQAVEPHARPADQGEGRAVVPGDVAGGHRLEGGDPVGRPRMGAVPPGPLLGEEFGHRAPHVLGFGVQRVPDGFREGGAAACVLEQRDPLLHDEVPHEGRRRHGACRVGRRLGSRSPSRVAVGATLQVAAGGRGAPHRDSVVEGEEPADENAAVVAHRLHEGACAQGPHVGGCLASGEVPHLVGQDGAEFTHRQCGKHGKADQQLPAACGLQDLRVGVGYQDDAVRCGGGGLLGEVVHDGPQLRVRLPGQRWSRGGFHPRPERLPDGGDDADHHRDEEQLRHDPSQCAVHGRREHDGEDDAQEDGEDDDRENQDHDELKPRAQLLHVTKYGAAQSRATSIPRKLAPAISR